MSVDAGNGGWAFDEGGVCAPKGFLASGVPAGIKSSGKRDLALLVSESDAAVSAMLTTNRMAAAPILLTRERVAAGCLRAVVMNSGNANACTGPRGVADAEAMCERAARALGVQTGDVAVASTGVIGVPMPMDVVLPGIDEAATSLDRYGLAAAQAIMTTDTFPKQQAFRLEAGGREYSIGGMAKGSGMIRPDMATMLCLITTDAPLTSEACGSALRTAVRESFHRITVDGETSTNDMVMLMANGEGGGAAIVPGTEAFGVFEHALSDLAVELARMIVRDGEGASKVVEVAVSGASDEAQAWKAAMAVANSPLFKCAVFGADPNWGRVVSAIGASGVDVDPHSIEVTFAGHKVCEAGSAVPFDEDAVAEAMRGEEVLVEADLHVGQARDFVWTCDLTYDYVRINADYRT